MTMQAVYAELAACGRMFYHFTASTISFILKKSLAEDEIELIREPKALRTVNGKNVDPKACAWVANSTIAPVLAEQVSPAQRGFIKGRQFIHNVIEVDAGARAADLEGTLGAMVPLDIPNAFPALSQEWLFLTVEKSGLQDGLLNLTRGCCATAAAFAFGGPEGLVFLF